MNNTPVCNHNFIQKDANWKSCTHCGMIVPLFFGVGHEANGNTAIELGIAIEKQQPVYLHTK